jgi:hypothetical protein
MFEKLRIQRQEIEQQMGIVMGPEEQVIKSTVENDNNTITKRPRSAKWMVTRSQSRNINNGKRRRRSRRDSEETVPMEAISVDDPEAVTELEDELEAFFC